MMNADKKRKKLLGRRFIISGIILLVFAFYIDTRVRPLIERAGEYQIRVAAVRIINDAILSELNNDAYDYEKIIGVNYDSSGGIKSITSDMNTINRLKSRSTLLINESVAELSEKRIGVSLGTVSGVGVFYGRGPVIPVRVLPKGVVNAVLVSDFSPAGINQTRHRIIMEVEAELTVLIPGYDKPLTVTTDYLVAETIIVGEIPRVYMNMGEAGGQLFGGTA